MSMGPERRVQQHTATVRESLRDTLPHVRRNDVLQLDRAPKVVRHTPFNDDSLVAHPNFVRAPSPRTRQEDRQARAAQGEEEQPLVTVDEVDVTSTVLHQPRWP